MTAQRYTEAPARECIAKGDGKHRKARYHSLSDYSKVRPMTAQNRDHLVRVLRSHDENSLDWYGIEGGADKVLSLIENGWPEGVKRMTESFSKLATSQTATSIRRVLKRGDHGDEFDIHRALTGNMDRSWSRRARGRRPAARHVTMLLNAAVPWNVKSPELFWKGAAILFLADTLSNAGYSVEVITGVRMDNVNDSGAASHITKAVTLKAASDPLNLNNLASGLCLAGFFRVLGFAHAAQCPFPINSGWGQAGNLKTEDVDAPDTTIVVQGRDIRDFDSAKAFIETTLAGIESGAIAL